ncbi:MAG: ArsR family transcriptional regulator [Chloroflexi bacterium AL-W]|nr:ArsR family transcriptional regulator [Chloroflexi bacterium AL-N1]NOK67192.1 ArsR family transcriptional regulator [Chloroflexi bacterium AL-N10]NOK75314.1 ArsR family transcriptional regulator [Chloroflexi bacterium AL-N5]NOK82102.1 ArsR family transcriptional regulator [Chloroflexi bacterium AL-W]NOK89947.1 ArsR family transcriptional regulator [Chloroflexi bacterium AL-N15]
MSMQRAKHPTAMLFRALMHPTRLAILDLLREGEACVCHMETALGCRQAYISQQLSVLRDAGLIRDCRDGLNIFYHVIHPELFTILDTARTLMGIPPCDDIPSAMLTDCPCPKCTGVDNAVSVARD